MIIRVGFSFLGGTRGASWPRVGERGEAHGHLLGFRLVLAW